jgi:allantoate deiminase
MEAAGMQVRVDAAGNLRGVYPGMHVDAPRLIIGSHLDTVRDAGAFDGVLGVVLGVALVARLTGRRLPIAIEVVGFSEEEGVRFGVPFIGSRALAGTLDPAILDRTDAGGRSVRQAFVDYGLDPGRLSDAKWSGRALAYLELHIEQGPVLDTLGLPVGVVSAIVGQSRFAVTFTGAANHAGTTPMNARRDALAGAAEWMTIIEREAGAAPGLVATVGRLDVVPGAANVIPGACVATLDVRHADDEVRTVTAARMIGFAGQVARRRQLLLRVDPLLDQPAVPTDASLRARLEAAVGAAGYPVHLMPSGAGHDAMVLARMMPIAMLFLRTPNGISHHPDESVLDTDVDAALRVGRLFLDDLAGAA